MKEMCCGTQEICQKMVEYLSTMVRRRLASFCLWLLRRLYPGQWTLSTRQECTYTEDPSIALVTTRVKVQMSDDFGVIIRTLDKEPHRVVYSHENTCH